MSLPQESYRPCLHSTVVDSGRASRRKALRGSYEEQSAAATYIQDTFVSAPRDQIEDKVAVPEHAYLNVQQEE